MVEENEIVEPYEKSLMDSDKDYNELWANSVLFKLSKVCDLERDEFFILAGKNYYENLIRDLKHYELPLGKLRYGERIEYLSSLLNNSEINNSKLIENSNCYDIHKFFNSLKRYNYNTIDEIPFENGIYIFFENGEIYKDLDRIVRVGTHRSNNRLKNRLRDHYKPNKDGSIFRKNIGRAILNYKHDSYSKVWEINYSNENNKEKYLDIRDLKKEEQIENRITSYLKNKFSFTCIEVKNAADRIRLEEGIIATLNMDKDFCPSEKWSGRFSPEYEIRNSGLWLKQGLDATPLTNEEINRIINGNIEIKEKEDDITVASNRKITEADRIRIYFNEMFRKHKELGDRYVRVISGDVNKALNYVPYRHPQISQVMWEFYNGKFDQIEHTTPSGKSSTISIIYDVNYK